MRDVPSDASTQRWLVRALDGAIADELRTFQRLGLGSVAYAELQRFRSAQLCLESSSAVAA